MEDPDPERRERILVLLDAGQPSGIRNRWTTKAKAKTDSRRGRASAYQNRVDQRAAVIRSGRQGLLETDGVPHHRRSRLSRVVDGAPHKTRHQTTVGGELGPHRRQTGADGGHHRLVVSCFIIVSRAGEWAKLTGDTTDIERRWRRMGPSRHGRWTGWGITEG